MKSQCPNEEQLIAYLSGVLADVQPIEEHLHQCTDCVGSLQRAKHLLSFDNRVDTAVPAALIATPAAAPAHPVSPTGDGRRTSMGRWLERIRAAFTLPVLAPVAAAALLLLAVGRLPIDEDTYSGELTRGHTSTQSLPITTTRAEVLASPTTSGQIIATLARGHKVAILNERSGWYEVRLDDGQVGWMDQGDFD